MPVDVSDLTVGPSELWIKPYLNAAAEPATPTTVFAAGWVFLGATDGGVNITVAQSFEQQYVDQTADPLASTPNERTIQIETTLTRVTLANLKIILNGGNITAAGSGASSTETFEPITDLVANDPTYYAICARGKAPSGQHRDVFGRRVLVTDDVSYTAGKTDKSAFSVTWTGHYVSTSVGPFAWRDSVAA
jgi:hypothetical protein